MAGFRVGVQRGSIYEKMVQSSLIETGLMSADKLLRYSQINEAIHDLVTSQIDLVVTGQATARYYNSTQALPIAGTGFGKQDLAIAMRSGTPRLKFEIDRVVKELLADGTISGLIQQYLETGGPAALPVPTSPDQTVATPTAAPLACLNDMKFITDVTYAITTYAPYVTPGTGFVKVWRVQNTGTCTWTPDYQLAFTYGNVPTAQMNGQPLRIPVNVLPGQIIDLSITMIAPQEPYTYQGFWQLQNAAGVRFGQTLSVSISTIPTQANPTSTLAVTSTPASSCAVTLVAPKKPVQINSSFDAAWMVKNTSGDDWNSGSVDYKYISGDQMQRYDVYDLPATIENGKSAKVIVDMTAPEKAGTYSTKWALVRGDETLCTMTVTVTVVKK